MNMTAQQITESIQSDIIIKDLYTKLEATIHEAIEHRQEQISNYYKPIWDKLNK